ncbi:hypothetical protein DFA_04615 [Cavenderia fasciculata]|uniref:BSD domain-containing protein n=1 Tax=Cavenderia fasciculata TaxID=261658 RepID=F4PQ24_CACFS|nr:uncharacterized protein DFA_04615 [Cavenderia fasciculata]EGG22487.1 hypothetical protein DFA_04615 [Cavenderia fasciculata]|eukprot:XP_004360338.1 hypothetical protein DFA_04615 [Cavenderia fasciculata]
MDLHFDPLTNNNNNNGNDHNQQQQPSNIDETIAKAAEEVTSYFKKGWSSFSFSSIVETVKQKSDEIINIYKEDLQEFGQSIHQDSVNTLHVGGAGNENTVMASSPPRSQTNPSLTEMLSSKITSFIAEYPSPYDNGSSSNSNNNNNSHTPLSSSPQITTSFDEVNRSLTNIDDTLYLADKNHKEYQTFKENFQLANYRELVISALTGSDNNLIVVQRNYNRLVPSKVTEFDFWCRYFYQEHVVKNQQQRRAQLITEAIKNLDEDDENINWDDDEDEDDIVNEIKNQSIILEKEKNDKLKLTVAAVDILQNDDDDEIPLDQDDEEIYNEEEEIDNPQQEIDNQQQEQEQDTDSQQEQTTEETDNQQVTTEEEEKDKWFLIE